VELQEAIRGRRSIRAYREKDVPEEMVRKIMEAGTWAPYGAERWIIIEVRDSNRRRAMLGWLTEQKRNLHVLKAPVNLVLCCDLREGGWPALDKRNHGKPDHRQLFSIQETAAMIQNMLLTAHELGLGACWNGSFDEQIVQEVLNLPQGIRPVAILSIGYPAATPPPPKRKTLEQIVYSERFVP
jgi:nitroreductase